MAKKINCFRTWCSKCKRPPIPRDDASFSTSKIGKNHPFHWICTFVALCCLGAWIIPEIKENGEYDFVYYPPNISKLKAKQPAIQISGIDFQSDGVKERLDKLSDRMVHVCRERSDDVVFAFQFGSSNKARRRDDHMFILCNDTNTMVIGNAEIISRSDTHVICTEEYDGELRRVKRPSVVSIKGIDINKWEAFEYDVSDVKESCIIQHAIDVLESKWV